MKRTDIMKRKAFTLIEILLVMSMIIFIGLFMLVSSKEYSSAANKAKNKYYQNSILNFISNAKHYCAANRISGYIKFDVDESTIYFSVNGHNINKLKAPGGFRLYDVNLEYKMMNIDIKGNSSDAFTIQYKDSYGKIHEITICVGTNYVDIK